MYICSVFGYKKMGGGETVTMSAGRLEECDNTFSQFVQLFDL